MSWLSAFSAITRPIFARDLAHPRLGQRPQWKPEALKLRAGGSEQEIALVAIRVGRTEKRPPAAPVVTADDIVAGRQEVGAEVVGGGEQINEFHVLVAGDARDRGLAGDIGAGKRLDDLLPKPLLIVEHVMGNTEPRGDIARVVDILPGATRALAMRRFAVVVELHRHADDVVAFGGKHRRGDRRVDPARHRHDDAGVGRRLLQAEAIERSSWGRREGGCKHDNLTRPNCRTTGYLGLPARSSKPIAQFRRLRHSAAIDAERSESEPSLDFPGPRQTRAERPKRLDLLRKSGAKAARRPYSGPPARGAARASMTTKA